MNTEINFLEKQPKKYLLPLILILIFAVLIVVVAILVYYQQNQYEKAIETEKEKITQIEALLQEHSQESATEEQLKNLKQEIDMIEDNMIPNVSLYQDILTNLDSPEQLTSFDYANDQQFVLEASFESLESVAKYLGNILEKGYILDADLTSINSTEDSYRATLTFNIDPDLMREELAENE